MRSAALVTVNILLEVSQVEQHSCAHKQVLIVHGALLWEFHFEPVSLRAKSSHLPTHESFLLDCSNLRVVFVGDIESDVSAARAAYAALADRSSNFELVSTRRIEDLLVQSAALPWVFNGPC